MPVSTEAGTGGVRTGTPPSPRCSAAPTWGPADQEPVEPAPGWLGTYERTGSRLTVAAAASGLVLRMGSVGNDAQPDEEADFPIVPTGPDSFPARNDGTRT